MRLPQSVSRWGEIAGRASRAVYEDDCLGLAGELAFFWFLALFPGLLFVVALAGSFPVQHQIDVIVEGLARVAPGDVLVLVREQLVQIAQGPPRGLLALSLMGALWSSSSAMTAIIETLNRAYHVKEDRPWWRVRLLAVVLTVVLTAFTLAAIGLMLAGPTLAAQFENSLRVPRRFAWFWAIAEWPVVFGLMMTAIGCVYQFAPAVRRRRRWVTPGSIAATLLWIIASLGLDWYADRLGDYQRTYGAIGGVIVVLLWLYASGVAILVGAELTAAVEDDAAGSRAPGSAATLGPHARRQSAA
jgi:membrane protein